MQCTSPKTAFVDAKTGAYIFYDDSRREIEREVVVRCGQCLSCRVSHAATWSTRAMHEARNHDATCFITLTYRPGEEPTTYEGWLADNQKFWKRLRRKFGAGVKFFGCLERGDNLGRPHSHFAVFGVDFKDDRKICGHRSGNDLFRSPTLEALWPHGMVSIGALTVESANYIARYTVKKLCGIQAAGELIDGERHFLDPNTGELTRLPYAKLLCSRRPAIGRDFVNRFTNDVVQGLRVVGGARVATPRSYLRWLRKDYPEVYAELLEERRLLFKRNLAEETPERCEVRDTVLRAQLGKRLERQL